MEPPPRRKRKVIEPPLTGMKPPLIPHGYLKEVEPSMLFVGVSFNTNRAKIAIYQE
jgi:hypothetical protein